MYLLDPLLIMKNVMDTSKDKKNIILIETWHNTLVKHKVNIDDTEG